MKNAKGQEVRWVIPEDMLAYAKEHMSPEKFAEFEASYKQALEQQRKLSEELRAKNTQTSVRVEDGQIVANDNANKLIWPPEEFWAPGCENSAARGTGEDERRLQADP